MTKQELLDSITKLHNWRQKFNGNDIGYGFDELKTDEKHHYPEAYAVFGRGYLKLYQTTHNEEYLECAMKCANWLLKNPSPRYTNLSWGLPWGWKTWDAPKELSYLVTTAIVGNFIMDLYVINGNQERLKQMKSITNWIIEENGYIEDKLGLLFYYANHASLKFEIINPSSLAAGFIGQYASKNQDMKSEKLASKAIKKVINNQQSNGSWFYSKLSDKIDSFHTGVILEGLMNYVNVNRYNINLKETIKKGTNYYRKMFFNSFGKGRDMIPQLHFSTPLIRNLRVYCYTKINYSPDARLWSYGNALAVLSRIHRQKEQKAFNNIMNYMINNLKNDDGSFAFNEKDRSSIIRNEAYAFFGLASSYINQND